MPIFHQGINQCQKYGLSGEVEIGQWECGVESREWKVGSREWETETG